jgi:hypothetical protein
VPEKADEERWDQQPERVRLSAKQDQGRGEATLDQHRRQEDGMCAATLDNSAGDDASGHRGEAGNAEYQAGRHRPEMKHVLEVQRHEEDKCGLHREDGQSGQIPPPNRRPLQHFDRDQWRCCSALDLEEQHEQDQSNAQSGQRSLGDAEDGGKEG